MLQERKKERKSELRNVLECKLILLTNLQTNVRENYTLDTQSSSDIVNSVTNDIVSAYSCIIITCWQSLLLSFILKLEIFYFYDDTQIDDLKIMELILTDLNVNSVSKVSGYSTLNINPTERVYNKS